MHACATAKILHEDTSKMNTITNIPDDIYVKLSSGIFLSYYINKLSA